MRLSPPTIPPDTPSDGEKLVFELLATGSAVGGGAEGGEAEGGAKRAGGAGAAARAGGAGAAARPGPTSAAPSPAAALDTSGWTVLHSLDIANHRRQMEGEIDFVCVVPGRGVLCLEVKGCHAVRRSGGLWYYGADAEGDARGPFEQASEAMHSLRASLAHQRPHLGGVPFQSAVCFPFLDFTLASEEWHDWQVIDRRDLEARPVAALIAAVLDRARERAAGLRMPWFDPSAGEPTAAQCDEIVRVLRPDFEFYESPKARARRLDEEIRRYTEEQVAVLDTFQRNPRAVVSGPAGTGKTLLAIEQARRSRDAGRRALLLCFNRPLSKWLAEEAEGTTVLTLHEYMRRVAGAEFTEARLGDRAFWQEKLPALALERLLEEGAEAVARAAPGVAGRGTTAAGRGPAGVAAPDTAAAAPGSTASGLFDELILDEGQDMLRRSYLDVLDLSLAGGLREGRFRIFGDFAHQAIYDAADMTFDDLLGQCPGCAIVDLTVNCRNSPRLVELVRGCDAVGWTKVRRPDDEQDPVLRFYRDADHQCELLGQALDELRDAGFSGPQVVVLSPHSDQACAAAGFCRVGGGTEDNASPSEPSPTRQSWRDRLAPLVPPGGYEPDMRSGKTKYASIYRYKGLEARAVVLTDIERLETEHDRDLFYIGATRATHRLVVLAQEGLRPVLANVAGDTVAKGR